MPKKIFSPVLVALMLLGIADVAAQPDLKELERERLAKARVKSQTEYTHDYKNGQPSDEGYKSSFKTFDRNGNLLTETNYNATGKVISVVNYQYDNKGQRVNYERYQGNREKLQYSQKTVYDEKGRKTREYGFDGTSSYSNTFAYNGAGKLSEIIYTSNKEVVEKRTLSYSGNKADIMVYDGSGKPAFRLENTYDARGNLLSEVKYNTSGSLLASYSLEYKDNKLLTSETKKRVNSLEYQKQYQYDKYERLVQEETTNMNGTKFISHQYQYTPSSFLELETWRKSPNSKESSSKKMDYDKRGIYLEVQSYFATYKLHSLYKYTYEFY